MLFIDFSDKGFFLQALPELTGILHLAAEGKKKNSKICF